MLAPSDYDALCGVTIVPSGKPGQCWWLYADGNAPGSLAAKASAPKCKAGTPSAGEGREALCIEVLPAYHSEAAPPRTGEDEAGHSGHHVCCYRVKHIAPDGSTRWCVLYTGDTEYREVMRSYIDEPGRTGNRDDQSDARPQPILSVLITRLSK